MAYVAITVSACEGKHFRLQALTVCPDTATGYTAEVHNDAMRWVIVGVNSFTRYDGRYRSERGGGKATGEPL